MANKIWKRTLTLAAAKAKTDGSYSGQSTRTNGKTGAGQPFPNL